MSDLVHFNLRWGILATGRSAERCAADLLLDPPPQGSSGVIYDHSLVAVASSVSLEAAQAFIARVKAPPTCVPFDSYETLLASTEIDIVYIGTPPSHHFQNVMAALHLGKHVICERPLAVNAKQARKLFAVAEAKKRFLMEDLSTRFLPAGFLVHHLIQCGVVGRITRVWADNSVGMDLRRDFDQTDRLLVPWSGGGALMDLAVYPLHWAFQVLPPRAKPRFPTRITSAAIPNPISQVDETITIVMTFPPPAEAAKDPAIVAIVTASLRAAGDPSDNIPVVRIQGDEGEIQVFGPAWRPSKVRFVEHPLGFQTVGVSHDVNVAFPNWIHGLRLEADEAAMRITYNMLESPLASWEDTLLRIRVMDSVRKQNSVCFPEEVESDDFPVMLPPELKQ